MLDEQKDAGTQKLLCCDGEDKGQRKQSCTRRGESSNETALEDSDYDIVSE